VSDAAALSRRTARERDGAGGSRSSSVIGPRQQAQTNHGWYATLLESWLAGGPPPQPWRMPHLRRRLQRPDSLSLKSPDVPSRRMTRRKDFCSRSTSTRSRSPGFAAPSATIGKLPSVVAALLLPSFWPLGISSELASAGARLRG
jgi:hypothetical protein